MLTLRHFSGFRQPFRGWSLCSLSTCERKFVPFKQLFLETRLNIYQQIVKHWSTLDYGRLIDTPNC